MRRRDEERLETFLGCPVDDLRGKTYVRAYHERTFDELLATLKKNRRRIQPDLDRRDPLEALRAEWDASMGKLRPLLVRLAATDRLIDLIVYRLYGLTEEEIAALPKPVGRKLYVEIEKLNKKVPLET